MECLIKISGAGGEEFRSRGEIDFNGETLAAAYTIGGDLCTLSVNGKIARSTRRGNVNLEMNFKEGETAFGHIGEGGAAGSFPVFTNGIEVCKTHNGVSVTLNYSTCGEEVVLTFVAAYIGG